MAQPLCLRWSDHMNNIMEVFQNLLSNEAMVDVTLACDGLSLKAHKVVLSACSPFFQSLFLENPCKHPIVIVKDMNYADLKAIIDFMYNGEVYVAHEDIASLIEAAKTLKVKGLSDVSKDESYDESADSRANTPPPKRKRRKTRKRPKRDPIGEEILQCKSDHRDSDMEDLSKQAFSDVEVLANDTGSSKVPPFTPAMPMLSPHKVEQMSDKKDIIIEDIFEEEESKYFPEFDLLLRQNLAEENPTGTAVQPIELEDDFLPAVALLMKQTLTEKGLSKTTVQSDVDELPRRQNSDVDELPAHPNSDVDELPIRPNSDVDELPTYPNSDVDELPIRPNSDVDMLPTCTNSDVDELPTCTNSDVDELPTHPSSDVDKLIQSNVELQEQSHSTNGRSLPYCTIDSTCTYHSTNIVTSSSGLDYSVSGTPAPNLTGPPVKDLRTGNSIDLNGRRENLKEALTQTEKQNDPKSLKDRCKESLTREENAAPEQEAAENRFVDACIQTGEEKDEAAPSNSPDENAHVNSERPNKKATSANKSSRKPLILRIPKNAYVLGRLDSQLKVHQRAKGPGRPKKIPKSKKTKLKKRKQKITNHTPALVPDASKTKSFKSSTVSIAQLKTSTVGVKQLTHRQKKVSVCPIRSPLSLLPSSKGREMGKKHSSDSSVKHVNGHHPSISLSSNSTSSNSTTANKGHQRSKKIIALARLAESAQRKEEKIIKLSSKKIHKNVNLGANVVTINIR